jgi:hypothetical protein
MSFVSPFLKKRKMSTTIKNASVKIMLSYNYCNFEISLSAENEDGIKLTEVDNLRKSCQRLADKAVQQFKIAKVAAEKRNDGEYQMRNFESECKRIKAKDEADRTIREIAMLKTYENENWEAQFQYRYDYEDEDEGFDF